MMYNGEVSCQTLTGKISIIRLNTHNFNDDLEMTEDKVRAYKLSRENDFKSQT